MLGEPSVIRMQRDELEKQLTKLTEDNRVLREALEFMTTKAWSDVDGCFVMDVYEKGREALAKTAREGE
jgi:hypothetical protein